MRRNSKVIVKESTGRRIIEQSRVRLWCVGLFFLLCFASIILRMIDVAIINNQEALTVTVFDPDNGGKAQQVELISTDPVLQRGDIVDRNGMLLATSLMTASVFVNPQEIRDKEETAVKLGRTLGMDSKRLRQKLDTNKSFLWIKRNLTPKEQQRVNSLGIPGLYFLPEERRVYPYGNLFSHVLGYVGIDNKGLAGLERASDQRLRDRALNREPLAVSIDARLQAILHEEVKKSISEFQAVGGVGVIADVHKGELLALVSLPDFDPHKPGKGSDAAMFNRASLGLYEMGSTFKTFTMAMALDYGVATMKSRYDATQPFRIASHIINDAHPERRWLTVPEVYAHSSNIGTARMVLDVGTKRQKAFMEKLGMLEPLAIELPETATPLIPNPWREINTVTVSYGHGISVTPLHLVRGIAAMVNGGTLPRLTLVKGGNEGKAEGERVISEETSQNMRRLMRLAVEHGTGSKADVPGYRVGGKTGTAEKIAAGKYEKSAKLTSFIGTFPVDNPRYVVLVMIDNPKGNASTFQFATGGWIAAPVAGRMIARMGPILGIPPVYDAPGDDAEKFWVEHKPKPAPAVVPAVERHYYDAAAY